VVKAITYVANQMPPRTIYIDRDEWTLDLEKERIKQDIEKIPTEVPETYQI